MDSSLTIWCNASFDDDVTEELKAGVKNHRLLLPSNRSGNLGVPVASELLAEADIAFGQPDPTQITELAGLKWIHLTSAGYTRYDKPEVLDALRSRSVAFTNSSSVFDDSCAQHVLAFMLAQARQLPEAVRSQLAGNKWRYEALRPAMRVLSDEVVLVLGYGAIARRLIELLSPFRLKIVALRRKVQGNETVETHAIDQLHRFLREADHVVNLLPSNSSTDELIDAECFATMKPNAVFYNVGRGTTVKQTDLVAALNSEELLAAYLDVTDPEPLPADSPLWSARNCWITPHVAGGHQDEESHMVRHFLTNLRRFESGQPLIDRIV